MGDFFYYFNGVQYYLGRFIRGDAGNMRIFTKFLCRISDKHVENILRGYFTRIFYEVFSGMDFYKFCRGIAAGAVLTLCGLEMIGRVVVSQTTGEPVVYASVGVVNRTLGTVTDSLGNFSLKVPQEYFNDTIRISSVGYVAQSYAVKDFAALPDTVRLADAVIELKEVVVKPQRIKQKTAGRRNAGGFIYINVEGYKAAGQGLAIPVKVKERAWLKELGFTIIDNAQTLSRMKFRINVYRKENGVYLPENIMPLYFDYKKSDLAHGKFTYRFPEEMMLERGEYYVEMEFLENFENEYFIMTSKPMTGKTRYRYASQSQWETLPFGSPIYIDYDSAE